MKKQIFSVEGTSCKSCEIVIERELKKQPDVLSVDVSHNKQRIVLTTNGKQYREQELNHLLKKHNYTVSGSRNSDQKMTRTSIDWKRFGAVAVFVFSLYVILDQLGLLRLSPSSAAPAGLVGVLLVGVIASVSSCTAVVGGLVAAISSAIAKDQENMTPRERIQPHILFNIGRIGGFFLLGALIGYLGSALQLSPGLNGIFIVAVAVLMIVIGVNLLEILPNSAIGMPKWLAHKVHDLAESRDPKAPLLLGASTFFLPCGFTQSMQLFALTLQDPIQSGLVMAVFAIGTMPVLLGIGSATSYASGNTLKKITQAAGIAVLVLGISNLSNGLTLVGVSPSLAFARGSASVDQPATNVENGRQQIAMRITERGSYEPNTLFVEAGTPVDWEVTGGTFLGCADTLILSTFGVNEHIKTGKNLIQFTPTKPGTYTFSCSMGMIRGTMVVNEPAS